MKTKGFSPITKSPYSRHGTAKQVSNESFPRVYISIYLSFLLSIYLLNEQETHQFRSIFVFTFILSAFRSAIQFFAGGMGGTVGAIVTCPLEVVKTRLQSSCANFDTVAVNRQPRYFLIWGCG